MMFLTKLAAVAAIAATVVSANVLPADAALATRDGKSCPQGQSYSGWSFNRGCVCKKGDNYFQDMKKCHKPIHPYPQCKQGEKSYCVRSEKEYCEYDDKNPYCWAYPDTYVFCYQEKELPKYMKEKYPYRPQCPKPRHFYNGQCQCDAGYIWYNNKCIRQPIPKPSCYNGQVPYCAKDYQHVIAYDEYNPYCADDGKNWVFCYDSSPGKVQDYCKKQWY